MLMTRFSMTRDINGYNGFGLSPTNNKVNTTLAAGVEQTTTVPTTGDAIYPLILAVFSFAPGSSIWVSYNATAAVPGASFVASATELNPAARLLVAGDVIHFITSDTSVEIGITYYAAT